MGASSWLTQVFPSYDPSAKKLKAANDIALYNHYVDMMPLDARQKALLKMKANTEGSVQTSIIPKPFRDKAIEQMGYDPNL